MSDIEAGWQDRVDKRRELLRTCQHRGERLTNRYGQLFCEQCCLHLTSDHVRNLLIDWISNHDKTSAQPEGTIDSEALSLIDDFEFTLRYELKGKQVAESIISPGGDCRPKPAEEARPLFLFVVYTAYMRDMLRAWKDFS